MTEPGARTSAGPYTVDAEAGTLTWHAPRRRPLTLALPGGDPARPTLAAVDLVQVRSLGSMGSLYGPNVSHRLGWGTVLLLDPAGLVIGRTRLTGWAQARADWPARLSALAAHGVEVRIDPPDRSYKPKQLCRRHPGALGLWPLRQDWSLVMAMLLVLVTAVAVAPVAQTTRGSEAIAVPVLVVLALTTAGFVLRPTRDTLAVRRLRRAARRPVR